MKSTNRASIATVAAAFDDDDDRVGWQHLHAAWLEAIADRVGEINPGGR